MSADARWVASSRQLRAVEAEETRRWGPEEGWSSIVLLLLMELAVAWAIDGARWAGTGAGNASQTAFLAWAAILAVLLGTGLAKTRLPALAAHGIAAAVGAACLLVFAAGAISSAPDLGDRLRELADSAAIFYHDLFVEGIRSSETSAFLLTVGAVVWGTAYFTAFNIFRRRQAFLGVLLSGLVLVINMSVTIEVQFTLLVIFCTAALLLVVRLSLVHQYAGWSLRRIDVTGVPVLFLRSGVLLVAACLGGSIVLASAASSAPLAGVWRNADRQLLDIGSELNRVVGGVTGPAKGPSGLFGTSQTIRGFWESSSEVLFRAESSDGQGYYWRGATYDTFDGATWQQLDRSNGERVAAGDVLVGDSVEAGALDEPARKELSFRVTSVNFVGAALLAPETPIALDQNALVFTHTTSGPVAAIELERALETGQSYTVRSLVRTQSPARDGITGNELAAAGTGYPDWIDRYLEVRPRSVGDVTYSVTQGIVDKLPRDSRDPYHVAQAVQDYLYARGGFRYQTDVRGMCTGQRLVDCFLQARRGYCEYFASALVMMLRTQGIPARLAVGYLPGRPLADGSFEVDRGAAHAWAEVYFPSYGWIKFDPTPGNQANGQRPTRLQPGAPVPTAASAPSLAPGASLPAGAGDRAEQLAEQQRLQRERAGGVAPGGGGGGADPGLLLILAAPVALAVLLVLWAPSRRSPGAGADLAYRGVTRIARRMGYGPRPAQTAYEFAGSLGELVPSVRAELQVVARAKVEATYGHREPGADALLALRDAYRRVRVGLVRLGLRRAASARPRRRR